jgi:hypothetical protein
MTTSSITAPIVVGSDDGILLFRTVVDAQTYLEYPDVEAGTYGPAFDAEGRLLAIDLPDNPFPARPKGALRSWWRVFRGLNAVTVRVVDDDPAAHRPELLALLRVALGDPGGDADGLQSLMASAEERFGVS